MIVQIDSDVLQELLNAAEDGAYYLSKMETDCQNSGVEADAAEDYEGRADRAYQALNSASMILARATKSAVARFVKLS
jgi:hypothetical protein